MALRRAMQEIRSRRVRRPDGGYAELRGEVAYELGPATAANGYEERPHSDLRVGLVRRKRSRFCYDIPRSETPRRYLERAALFATLNDMKRGQQ